MIRNIIYDSKTKRGTLSDSSFFKKYFSVLNFYCIRKISINDLTYSFFLHLDNISIKTLSDSDNYYYVVGPDQKIITRNKCVTNNYYVSQKENIPFMYVPNEFKIQRVNEYCGTYLTPNTSKLYKFIEWFKDNEIYPFYVMGNLKEMIILKRKFPKINITTNKEEFFKNVKYIKYFIVDDWFEFCPNFIKEAINCNCEIELFGKSPEGCGVKYLLDNYYQLNNVEYWRDRWKEFLNNPI